MCLYVHLWRLVLVGSEIHAGNSGWRLHKLKGHRLDMLSRARRYKTGGLKRRKNRGQSRTARSPAGQPKRVRLCLRSPAGKVLVPYAPSCRLHRQSGPGVTLLSLLLYRLLTTTHLATPTIPRTGLSNLAKRDSFYILRADNQFLCLYFMRARRYRHEQCVVCLDNSV